MASMPAGDEWTSAIPPTQLHLACGGSVEHATGARVFNYYDHKPGVIEQAARYPSRPVTPTPDGAAWWVKVRHDDGTAALLDQSRMCTVEYARSHGWLKS